MVIDREVVNADRKVVARVVANADRKVTTRGAGIESVARDERMKGVARDEDFIAVDVGMEKVVIFVVGNRGVVGDKC